MLSAQAKAPTFAPIGNPLPMEPYARPTAVDTMPSAASVLASPRENATALLAAVQWHGIQGSGHNIVSTALYHAGLCSAADISKISSA